MSISTKGSAKALLAALGVAAAIGVYAELSSLPGNDEFAAERPERGTNPGLVERAVTSAPEPVAPPFDLAGAASPGSNRGAGADSGLPAPAATSAERAARPPASPGDEVAPPSDDPVARAATVLATRLASEPLDTEWAPVAEGLLADHFASSEGSAASIEARCRSSVCRIELAFENEAMRDEGLGSLTLPWDTTGVFHLDERDPLRLVIYATREPEDQAPRG